VLQGAIERWDSALAGTLTVHCGRRRRHIEAVLALAPRDPPG